jgi:catechol 2,3-dioxygenase-like lactoylglutathione lyase family enzyme
MLRYVNLGSNDLAAAGRFYDAVLGTLGLVRLRTQQHDLGYGPPGDAVVRLWVLTPFDRRPASFGNGAMLAFTAPSRAAVEAFHAAALAHGGRDEGAPGLRPYEPDFYACYVRDPDGNKLSAVCVGPG